MSTLSIPRHLKCSQASSVKRANQERCYALCKKEAERMKNIPFEASRSHGDIEFKNRSRAV